MLYWYRARDPLRRRVEGELEAVSVERLLSELEGRSLEVLRYRVIPESELRDASQPVSIIAEPSSQTGLNSPSLNTVADAEAETVAEGDGAGMLNILWTIGVILYVLYRMFQGLL